MSYSLAFILQGREPSVLEHSACRPSCLPPLRSVKAKQLAHRLCGCKAKLSHQPFREQPAAPCCRLPLPGAYLQSSLFARAGEGEQVQEAEQTSPSACTGLGASPGKCVGP